MSGEQLGEVEAGRLEAAVFEQRRLSHMLRQRGAEIEALSASRERLTEKGRKAAEREGELRRQLRKLEERAGALNADRDRVASELDRATTDLDRVASELDRATTDLDRVASELDRATTELDRATTELKGAQYEARRAERRVAKAEQGTAEAREQARRRRREDEKQLVALSTDRDRLTTDRDRIAADRDRIAADRDRLATDRDRVEVDRDRLAAELKQAQYEARRAERRTAKAERDAAEADRRSRLQLDGLAVELRQSAAARDEAFEQRERARVGAAAAIRKLEEDARAVGHALAENALLTAREREREVALAASEGVLVNVAGDLLDVRRSRSWRWGQAFSHALRALTFRRRSGRSAIDLALGRLEAEGLADGAGDERTV